MKIKILIIIFTFIFMSKICFGKNKDSNIKQLTLEQCIEFAIENNLALKQKKMIIEKNTTQENIIKTQKKPNISFFTDYTHTSSDNRLFPAEYPNAPGLYTNDILTSRIAAKMPLFDFGKISNEIEAAEMLKKQSQYFEQLSIDEIKFNVANIYFSILKQNKIIESLESGIKTLNEQKNRIDELVKLNKKTEIDSLKIDYRVSELKQELINALSKKDILYFNLNFLINKNNDNFKVKDCEICVDTNINLNFNEQIEIALKQRKDLIASEVDLKIKQTNIEIAKSRSKPTLNVFSNIDNKYALKDDIVQTNAYKNKINWIAGINFEIPIWNGGRISEQIKQAELELEISRAEFEKLKEKIIFELRSVLKNIESNRERIKTSLKNIEVSEFTLKIEKEKYELGKSSITDVLIEETNYLKAKTQYYSMLYDYAIALENLKFITGN